MAATELPRLQARVDLGHGDLVVARHRHLGTELTEVLHDVVGKTVVVIDHQHVHSAHPGVGADPRKRANSPCSKAMYASIMLR